SQSVVVDAGVIGGPPEFGWALRAGASNSGSNDVDAGNQIAVDADGNVYVAGTFRGTVDFDPSPAVVSLTSASQSFYLARYARDGALVWIKQSSSQFEGLSVDPWGDIYTITNIGVTTPVGSIDTVVTKRDPLGNTIWSRQIGTNVINPTL